MLVIKIIIEFLFFFMIKVIVVKVVIRIRFSDVELLKVLKE